MKARLSSEVAHLEGQHKERYLAKLCQAGLDNDPYLMPAGMFTEVMKITSITSLPDFAYHDLYHYVVNNISPYTGEDLKAFKSLDAYHYFVAGWVTSLQVWQIPSRNSEERQNYLVMAKVG